MVEKKECCGCTACLQVCPVNCITMQEDEEGFLYPVTEEEQCIHCHKCESVCPVQYPEKVSGRTETYVGYYANDEIRQKSSSGGIFTAVAEWILQQNGVVFGAAYDEHFEVHHIAVEKEEELEKLRGSKYVQSNLGNVYPEVREYLEKKRKVLFTGTACQIAGLKKYLNREYDELYTIDVLCHGVPSSKIWRMYLDDKMQQYQAQISKIDFRNKRNGWRNYGVSIGFTNGQQYFMQYYQDPFFRMFLENLDLRSSCYKCRFKKIPRISDMTIGDCWDAEKHISGMDDDRGISVILIHSANGKRIFQETKKKLVVREAKLNQVLPPMAESRMSAGVHPNRNRFWNGVRSGERFDELYGYVQKSFIQKINSYLRYLLCKYFY